MEAGLAWAETAKPPPSDSFDGLIKSLDKTQPPPIRTSEKDYIWFQVASCWNVDPGGDGGVAKVKIAVSPDGTVTEAKLVDLDEARYASDRAYRAAWDSARRAVLMASPLKAPPGNPDFFKTFSIITLNFNPKDIAR